MAQDSNKDNQKGFRAKKAVAKKAVTARYYTIKPDGTKVYSDSAPAPAKKAVAKKVVPGPAKKSVPTPAKKAVARSFKEIAPVKKTAAVRVIKTPTESIAGYNARINAKQRAEELKSGRPARIAAAAKARRVNAARVAGKVAGKALGAIGIAGTAAEAARLATTKSGRREYMDMRKSIDNAMRGKNPKGKDLIPKGTIYTTVADSMAKKNRKKGKK